MYRSPCPVPSTGAAPGVATGLDVDALASAIASRLAETVLQVRQPVLKGPTVVAIAGRGTAYRSDVIDVRGYNALYVQVFITGASASAVVAIMGTAGGVYQDLADPNARRTITASTAYEVVCGAPDVVVDLSSVSGTGVSVTVYVTPFVSPGSTNIQIDTSSALPAGSNTIGGTTDSGPHWSSVFGVSGARFTSADQSASAASVTDAPTAGQKLVITDLVVSVDTAMRVDFKEETSGTVLLSLYMAANSSAQVTPRSKLKLATADKRLQVQTSAAGKIAVTAFYYSEA